jgi:TolB-like protein/class 3 adenylate cyclase/Flp pilus assembly protein TadD
MPSHSASTHQMERQLVVVLAADVAGYSRLVGTDEEGTHAQLRACRQELIEPCIAAHQGGVVKTTGDGMLVRFASPVEATRCAVEIQQGMTERNAGLPDHKRLQFRIGINLGDVIVEDGDIFGDGVNVAARLEALAEPGGICISRSVRDQVRDRVPLAFEDLGEQQVKNIARPLHIYRVCKNRSAQPAEEPSPSAGPALALPDKPSIAVLPFANMSGDPEQEYFVDGTVEEIITALSQIRWLFVVARNSTFTYKARAVDVKQVGRELGVGYVLEGSVRKAGKRVRITAQLIDTASSAHIWTDRFDGVLDDIFELQDRVAVCVAGVIEPRLRTSEIERANRKPPQSLDAYDLYLRALGQFHMHSQEGALKAIDLLKQALAIDPTYAPAAALIGECHVSRAAHAGPPVSRAEIEESVRLARQAIQWGKDDPDALWMAAICLSNFAGEYSAAAHLIERALTLNPNSAHAWNAKGYVAYRQNQLDSAVDAFNRAIRLSPLDPLGGYFSNGLAIAHLASGRYEEALEWAERALHEFPEYPQAIRSKIVACVQLGRMAEARKATERMLELYPASTIAKWRERVIGYVLPEVLAVYVDSLRKAGMPEE